YMVRRINSLNIRLHTLKESTRKLTLLLDTNGCISNPCRNGGTCHDLFSGFICLCPPEWENSVDMEPVYLTTMLLHIDAFVTKLVIFCFVKGWTTDGKGVACDADVDECSMVTSPCSIDPPVRCENLPGYSGNGYYCLDIDECETFNGGCSTNPMVQCVNTIGSRICGDCPPGYSGDGTTCSYIGICSINNGGCHSLATCTNQPKIGSNFVECKCRGGFTGSGIGAKGCTPIKDPCVLNPCKNGECIINGTNACFCECFML
ncbi:EGF 3 domain containing protein, partial [Asbolus verrucosus]